VEAGQPAPAAGTKTAPWPWGVGQPATVPAAAGWCLAGGTFSGVFTDIGFRATGNVNYVYGVNATTVAAPGLYTTTTSCALAVAGTTATGALGNNNFYAIARSNLDGDANISTWDSTVDHGANDCTTGVF